MCLVYNTSGTIYYNIISANYYCRRFQSSGRVSARSRAQCSKDLCIGIRNALATYSAYPTTGYSLDTDDYCHYIDCTYTHTHTCAFKIIRFTVQLESYSSASCSVHDGVYIRQIQSAPNVEKNPMDLKKRELGFNFNIVFTSVSV